MSAAFQVNTFTPMVQMYADIASAPDGRFVVVWESWNDYPLYVDVFGQRFDSSGGAVGTEFQVNASTQHIERRPAVAVADAGEFVIAWDKRIGYRGGILFQRFDSGGTPQGTAVEVTETIDLGGYSGPRFNNLMGDVSAAGDGSFMVVWASSGYPMAPDGDSIGVFARRFDSLGAALGAELQVNTFTTSAQGNPAVARDGDSFIVVWESTDQDGPDPSVFAQRYDGSGAPFGIETRVSLHGSGYQYTPAVACDATPECVVVWSGEGADDPWGIFGRRLEAPVP